MKECWFGVGSLKFKNFRELYENIKGRTTGFSKDCVAIYDEKPICTFGLTYEKQLNVHRFILEADKHTMLLLKANKEASEQLKSQLPKFKKIGSLAPGGDNQQKFYGYINIKDITDD